MKQRIYKNSRDLLMQLERAERVDKVEGTLGDLVGDYERLLRRMKERGEMGGKNGAEEQVAGNGVVGRRERGKRKVVVDEEEELEGTPEPKKAKEGDGG